MTRATTLCAVSKSALALGRRSAAFLLVVTLGGCVTGAAIPNSPFLTAMVRLNPVAAGSSATAMAASNANSPLDANAALADLPLRGSLSQSASAPVAGGAPQHTPPPAPFIAPSPERSQVYPQLAAAQSNLTTAVAPVTSLDAGPKRANDTPARGGRTVLLGEAVGVAVLSHPLMGAQAAKVTGSLADVRTAQGALKPQLQVYAGSGGSYLGSYLNYPQQFGSVAVPGSSRSDAGFTLRQLV